MGHIHLGVITGLNRAFVINQVRRDEIIGRPILRAPRLSSPWLRGP